MDLAEMRLASFWAFSVTGVGLAPEWLLRDPADMPDVLLREGAILPQAVPRAHCPCARGAALVPAMRLLRSTPVQARVY